MAKESKELIITGGAGFIGAHACEAFLKAGAKVAVIDNFNDFYDPAIKRQNIRRIKNTYDTDRFSVYEADIRDQDAVDAIFKRHDGAFVVHLAACAGVRPSIDNPRFYADVNIAGTLTVLESMKAHGMKKLIFASSSSVYGENAAPLFSEGQSDTAPVSPYAATKRAGELLCHTYRHLYGFSVACLRFFTVYGPGQRPDLAVSRFAKRILSGRPVEIFGDGQALRDFTYIDDIIAGIAGAYRWVCGGERLYEIFNIGGGNPVTVSDLIKTLEKATGRKAEIIKKPTRPGDVSRTAADIEKAARFFGYRPATDFETGIRQYVAWLREGGRSDG